MNVIDKMTGQTFQFPDDATDDDIIAAMESGRPAPKFSPIAQQFASGIGGVAQQLIQGPQTQSTLPNIGGGAMVGLTPQQAQWTLDRVQQSNVNTMANKMQQQKAVQDQLEAEKDRAQTLKLEQQRLKNQMNERKLMEETERLRVQEQELTKGIEAEERTKQAEIEAMGKFQVLSPGQVAYNPFTKEKLVGEEKTFAPRPEPRVMQRTYTGLAEDGQYYQFTESFDPVTGVPLGTAKSEFPVAPPSGAGKPQQPIAPTSEPVMKLYQSMLAEEMKADADRAVKRPVQELMLNAQVMARQAYGLPVFDDDVQKQTYQRALKKQLVNANKAAAATELNVRADQLPEERLQEIERMAEEEARVTTDYLSGGAQGQQAAGPAIINGPTPEQQEEMRTIRQAGGQVAFDPATGEVIYVGGR